MNLELQADIERRIDRGHSLRSVDRHVNGLPLSSGEREELLIWAWAWRESGRRAFIRYRVALVALVASVVLAFSAFRGIV